MGMGGGNYLDIDRYLVEPDLEMNDIGTLHAQEERKKNAGCFDTEPHLR